MVTIATWNVNSITARLPQVVTWLSEVRPNVLCLQETKVTDDKFPVKEFSDLGFTVEIFGEKAYNGVALIADRQLTGVSRGLVPEVDPVQCRLITGMYEGIKIIDVYMPNGQEVGSDKYAFKLRWMSALRQYLDSSFNPEEKVVMVGDFNVAPLDIDVYDPKAFAGNILVSDAEREALEHVRRWGFVDVFRAVHADARLFSWWDYRQDALNRNLGLRIDHVWATEVVARTCKSIYIDKDARKSERPSDHAPVVAQFSQ